jgi:hypothetical protein
MYRKARLAQLVERKTFNLVVVGSSPTVGTRVVGLKQLGIIYKILIRRYNRVSLNGLRLGDSLYAWVRINYIVIPCSSAGRAPGC